MSWMRFVNLCQRRSARNRLNQKKYIIKNGHDAAEQKMLLNADRKECRVRYSMKKYEDSPQGVERAMDDLYHHWKYNEDIERLTELYFRVAETDAPWEDDGKRYGEPEIKQMILQEADEYGKDLLARAQDNPKKYKVQGMEYVTSLIILYQIFGCYENLLRRDMIAMPWQEWYARCIEYLNQIDYPQKYLQAKLADESFDCWAELLPKEW